MKRSLVLVLVVGLAVSACSEGSSENVGDTGGVDTQVAPQTQAPNTDPPPEPWPYNGDCEYMSMKVDPPLESAEGAFTVSPFDLNTVRMFINGSEGNGTDPRFSYVLIQDEGELIPIYAPAPMVLVKMRYKDGFVMERTREAGDWDLTFLVSCDVQVRINHITNPSDVVLAAYGYGSEPGTYWTESGEQIDDESKMVPASEVRFNAGDLIGYTSGTQNANFDYVTAVDEVTMCPWEIFEEPVRSELLAKLGPPPDSPDAGPVANWACTGYGGPM
jgi:hypothetical protein